ncbi:hypothetical protein SOCEGT47_052580 [Sorangium cellulosum]|uniref:Uncharacterized protein n=1 Tax=Sorangium cellulosum TaxID=56 RepID=A0A4P2Q5R2_SORCE|nr:hypothetical protein [Sorangium cellulosum]AUX24719.1 hypothetical protein SOCEGT47_052580 [Sorangium cellulosum]
MNSRPPFPSSPPSQPSPYRYLGRGGSERPVRLQIIIALVAGLIVVAVPLYLWRRPKPESIPSADAATVDAGALALDAGVPADADAGQPERVTLSPFTTIRCQNPGPGTTPPDRCDHITFFEDGLARAIRDSVPCAPTGKSSITVSFVLDMDFRRKRTNLYAGKSTTVKRTRTRELIRCVKRAMPKPDWAAIPHQYVKYKINVMATYPPSDGDSF